MKKQIKMAILWIIQKHKDSMEILLMNSMNKKKGVGFGFDLKIWVGFEKHPINTSNIQFYVYFDM